jgi:hypothetical protein
MHSGREVEEVMERYMNNIVSGREVEAVMERYMSFIKERSLF